MMPENGGIRNHVRRGIDRAENQRTGEFPKLSHLDWKITGTVVDTVRAAREMKEQGVAAIVVLGGDGTHRAVVAACGDVPIAGISTGTNNAFPEHREPTITGLAVGLAVMDKVPSRTAFSANKQLVVTVGGEREIALVDAAVVAERFVGARALWRTDTFRELYVTFADPEVIGMSAIAGLLRPVSAGRAIRAAGQARLRTPRRGSPSTRRSRPAMYAASASGDLPACRRESRWRRRSRPAPSPSTANANCRFRPRMTFRSSSKPMPSAPST